MSVEKQNSISPRLMKSGSEIASKILMEGAKRAKKDVAGDLPRQHQPDDDDGR